MDYPYVPVITRHNLFHVITNFILFIGERSSGGFDLMDVCGHSCNDEEIDCNKFKKKQKLLYKNLRLNNTIIIRIRSQVIYQCKTIDYLY